MTSTAKRINVCYDLHAHDSVSETSEGYEHCCIFVGNSYLSIFPAPVSHKLLSLHSPCRPDKIVRPPELHLIPLPTNTPVSHRGLSPILSTNEVPPPKHIVKGATLHNDCLSLNGTWFKPSSEGVKLLEQTVQAPWRIHGQQARAPIIQMQR